MSDAAERLQSLRQRAEEARTRRAKAEAQLDLANQKLAECEKTMMDEFHTTPADAPELLQKLTSALDKSISQAEQALAKTN